MNNNCSPKRKIDVLAVACVVSFGILLFAALDSLQIGV